LVKVRVKVRIRVRVRVKEGCWRELNYWIRQMCAGFKPSWYVGTNSIRNRKGLFV
jgi:hypothetical protein